jgi:alkylhydroperoxidase/carboxymuconolactone decarboxylase family protein YurZ
VSASVDTTLTPMQYLVEHHPSVGTALRDHVRAAVEQAGPMTPKVRELVLLSSYTASRQPRGLGVHCGRALDAGADPREIRQAVLLTLGASATLEMVVDALRWVDEVCAARGIAMSGRADDDAA